MGGKEKEKIKPEIRKVIYDGDERQRPSKERETLESYSLCILIRRENDLSGRKEPSL